MAKSASKNTDPRRYGKAGDTTPRTNENTVQNAGVKALKRKKGTHMPTIIPEVNERFRAIRLEMGLTQKEFAEALDITLSTVKAVENKVVAPNLYILRQLHRKSGKSYDFILEGK